MLTEILEADAAGETAAIYGHIKQVQGTTVVNLIWRHLATIEGGLAWAWPAAQRSLPAIRASTGPAFALADTLVQRHGLATGLALPLGPEALDVLRVYDRGNCFNMLAMTALAAMRHGAAPPVTAADTPGPGRPTAPVPPMPRFDTLALDERATIERLAEAGPAAASGVRPSLWVHLALWPELLHRVAAACIPVLASPPFHAAHSALREEAAALLGLPPLTSITTSELVDVAIERFRQRIPEMLLIGRVLLRATGH